MTTEEFKQEAQNTRLRLINQARRYLGDTEDALLRLWQMHMELQQPMLPLALVVTRNLAIDRLRRHQQTQPLETVMATSEPDTDERTARILAIIDTLSPMLQTVLRLRHMEGMEMSDIAELTGSSEVAVRKALSRARMAVRERYFKKDEG